MEKQGFDPMEKTLNEVIDKMESLESTEDFDHDKDTKQVAKRNGKGKGGKKSSNSNGKQNLYCMYHGEGNHKTEDCYQLQKEAKRLKKGKGEDTPKFKNKTWNHKAVEANKESKNDLAAFIRKEVKKGFKKDLKAMAKKRKATEDSDSDGELHCSKRFELKDFNYEDMKNLKIDNDVSNEVSC